MHVFVQACILGLLMGGVYALMASGLALVFGIMRVINVAQGALIVMGAFLSYSLFTRFHIDPFVGVLVIAPAMFVLGIGLQLAFLRPLREQDREELSLLVTWAIALGIEGVLSYAYSTTYRTSITGYANRAWDIAGYRVPEVRLFACVLSFVTIGLLYLILARTRFGRSVRATVQNPVSARLLGVDTAWVSAVGFGLGAATAAVAGAAFGIIFPFNPGSHYDLISRLLAIIVLGGLGSLGGAVLAGLLMGLAEAVFQVEISPTWAPLTFFVLLIVVLLVRPQGLFGTTVRGAA
jgi:branched-chain amino acid transport system permease protein